jgi:nitrate reductase gamma subunit
MVTREVFWGVQNNLQYLFYAAAALSILVFLYGLWKRMSVWTLGSDGKALASYSTQDFLVHAIKSFFSRDCILAKRSFALASYRGVMLFFIIWGFMVLFLGTILLTIHHYFFHFLEGTIYLTYSFLLDIAGALLLIGLVVGIGRRHLISEVRKNTDREDLFFLYLFLLIVVSGFVVEGMRLLVLAPANMDYSLIGSLTASIIRAFGVTGVSGYALVWGVHVASVLLLIATLPYSKFFHVFSSQITVVAAQDRYGGGKK